MPGRRSSTVWAAGLLVGVFCVLFVEGGVLRPVPDLGGMECCQAAGSSVPAPEPGADATSPRPFLATAAVLLLPPWRVERLEGVVLLPPEAPPRDLCPPVPIGSLRGVRPAFFCPTA